jgi:iron(III) transport system substrate-binding protein
MNQNSNRANVTHLLIAAMFCSVIVTSLPKTTEGASSERKTEWERVLAAAKQEGRVVVYGPLGTDFHNVLTIPFRKKHPDIQIEFIGASGALSAQKILAERRGGIFLADVYLAGITSLVTQLKPAGTFEPIQPFLLGPEVQDQSKWTGGKFEFADSRDKMLFVFHSYVSVPFAYNPELVNPSEIRSWKDFLDPKWTGKLVMHDPKIPGPGVGRASHIYNHKELGKEFIRQLFTRQKISFLRDQSQILDGVVRGRYALTLAFQDVLATDMREKGIKLGIVNPDAVKEGSYVTPGTGGIVAIVNKAPHPNAAKVYLNWLLSREGQYEISKEVAIPSRRVDVPTNHLPDIKQPPKPGSKHIPEYDEEDVLRRPEMIKFIQSLTGG